jgi:hypothetical protein
LNWKHFFLKGNLMGITDDIVAAVAASTKLDVGTKSIVTEFLQAIGPAVGVLAPEALKEVLAGFAGGDATASVTALANSLNAEQVTAALDATQQEMNAEVDQRATQVAAAQAATGALETAALSILSRLVISAL